MPRLAFVQLMHVLRGGKPWKSTRWREVGFQFQLTYALPRRECGVLLGKEWLNFDYAMHIFLPTSVVTF